MKKFDFAKMTSILFRNIEAITNVPDQRVFYDGTRQIDGYPYITWQITSPHDVEQSSLDRQYQIFDLTINLNIYSDQQSVPIIMSTRLSQLLFNYYFDEPLRKAGCVIRGIKPNGSSLGDISSANSIYNQNLQIILRLSSYYILSYKNYYRILNTNLNRSYKIKYFVHHKNININKSNEYVGSSVLMHANVITPSHKIIH